MYSYVYVYIFLIDSKKVRQSEDVPSKDLKDKFLSAKIDRDFFF